VSIAAFTRTAWRTCEVGVVSDPELLRVLAFVLEHLGHPLLLGLAGAFALPGELALADLPGLLSVDRDRYDTEVALQPAVPGGVLWVEAPRELREEQSASG